MFIIWYYRKSMTKSISCYLISGNNTNTFLNMEFNECYGNFFEGRYFLNYELFFKDIMKIILLFIIICFSTIHFVIISIRESHVIGQKIDTWHRNWKFISHKCCYSLMIWSHWCPLILGCLMTMSGLSIFFMNRIPDLLILTTHIDKEIWSNFFHVSVFTFNLLPYNPTGHISSNIYRPIINSTGPNLKTTLMTINSNHQNSKHDDVPNIMWTC